MKNPRKIEDKVTQDYQILKYHDFQFLNVVRWLGSKYQGVVSMSDPSHHDYQLRNLLEQDYQISQLQNELTFECEIMGCIRIFATVCVCFRFLKTGLWKSPRCRAIGRFSVTLLPKIAYKLSFSSLYRQKTVLILLWNSLVSSCLLFFHSMTFRSVIIVY